MQQELEGLSPEKPHKDNVKVSIEAVIGNKVNTKKIRKTAEDKKKEAFCKCISMVDNVVSRKMLLQDDFGIDMASYDEPYVNAIEALLTFIFTPNQRSFIDFYLYDRMDEYGDPVDLEDQHGNLIELDTPDQLYEFLKTVK